MSLAELRQRLYRLHPLQRLALIVWFVLALASLGRAALYSSPHHHGCYWIFADAGKAWRNGQDLYTPRGGTEVFRYSPLVGAALTVPSALPDALGSALLRLVNVVVFLGGVFFWSRWALPLRISPAQRGLVWLLVVPLSASSLLDVQTTALTVGLLLLAMAAAARDYWSWAAVFVTAACAIKVYPLALALLLILLYPSRFTVRFGVAVLICLALPFLFGSPTYVLRQYGCWVRWALYERRHEGMDLAFRDLRLLFRVWLTPLSERTYFELRLGAAAGIAVICFLQRLAGAPRRRMLATVLGLSCCWMMLLGPATEHQTYVFLAPSLAWAVVEAWVEPLRLRHRVLRGASLALFTIIPMAVWFPHGTSLHQLGAHAVAGLLLAISLAVVELCRDIRLEDELAVDAPVRGVYTPPLRRAS